MELGMVGLGRMGGDMARRLTKGGHRVVVYDPMPSAVDILIGEGCHGITYLNELASNLSRPRIVWVMAPSGDATETTIDDLCSILSVGDTIVDGGNANYKDTIRRAVQLKSNGILFLDVGTSGGIWGLKKGYSLMVGGEEQTYQRLMPILKTLSSGNGLGLGYVGPAGAGHFVKMIHNAIEYGIMQAYAEGFELMGAKKEFNLKLEKIAEIWRHGSVVQSWLLDLIAAVLKETPHLGNLQAYVEDSGEGRWAVQESVDLSIPAPVISASLQARFRSRQEEPFGPKLLSAMRNKFGGHNMKQNQSDDKYKAKM